MTELIQGDAREVLPGMPAGSVHLCITSPPYWGLRAYEAPDLVWGGEPGCEHDWGAHLPPKPGRGNKPGDYSTSSLTNPDRQDELPRAKTAGQFCQRCGAWRGQLGAEPTPDLYVAHLVEVFRELRRVLRPDGLLFLNLGDSYTSGGRADFGPCVAGTKQATNPAIKRTPRAPQPPGLKPKDLCEVPSDVVKALRADGWWLRSRIPWLKQNPMPDSTADRPGSGIEYWFMLTPNARCYWDPEAVRIASVTNDPRKPYGSDGAWAMDGRNKWDCGAGKPQNRDASTRNRRNSDWLLESFQGLILDELGGPLVMLVNPQGYDAEFCRAPDCQRYYDGPDKKLVRIEKYTDEHGEKKERRWCLCGRSDAWLSHYATFPELGVEAIIKAATSERGVCPSCGSPWRRIVKKAKVGDWHADPRHKHDPGAVHKVQSWAKQPASYKGSAFDRGKTAGHQLDRAGHGPRAESARTLGWRPTCNCGGEPVPCVVCDPFAGTFTVGVVAEQLGRGAILIEISPDYVAMGKARLAAARREPVPACDPALPLFTEAR